MMRQFAFNKAFLLSDCDYQQFNVVFQFVNSDKAKLVDLNNHDSEESSSHRSEENNRVHETILVVEDDPLLLEFVDDLLSFLGYKVLTASNTDQALKYVEDPRQYIDLVFSDIRIPGGVSGLGLAKSIKQMQPKLRILLTTGFSQEYLKDAAYEEFPMIQKPYLPEDLTQRVRAILDGP